MQPNCVRVSPDLSMNNMLLKLLPEGVRRSLAFWRAKDLGFQAWQWDDISPERYAVISVGGRGADARKPVEYSRRCDGGESTNASLFTDGTACYSL